MAVVRRGWSCSGACEPNWPCYAPGCPNALPYNYNHHQGSSPYYYSGFSGPNPNFQGPYGPHSYHGRWSSGPNYNYRPPPPQPYPPRNPGQDHAGGTVRIGVGNRSNTDIDVHVHDNLVTGGRQGVSIGSGNYAARSNMGAVANNKSDADELMIGADNYSASGDNKIRVTDNDFTGFRTVRIGVGNRAGGSNRVVVGGASGSNSDGNGAAGNNNGNRWNRRRSWLWW